jgi:hypothetical protein
MLRDLRIVIPGLLITALFGWFALSGALEGRGRDALEGGVPAAILGLGCALIIRRIVRRIRDS